MTNTVGWFDRLRIERVVWSLDQRLYDLPRRARIGHRRDVRANLLSAANDVGATAALRQLGGADKLANEYLTAQYGETPRPSWMAAAIWITGLPFVTNWLMYEAIFAFRDGVVTRDPHATGSYSWGGIGYIQSHVDVTFTDGKATWVGGAWTPLVYALLLVGAVLVGRLWRVPLAWRRRRAEPASA